MQRRLLFFVIAVLIMTTSGCARLKQIVYRPDINQGNYLAKNDVAKIHAGMTQQQVVYTLGTPMLKEPFNNYIWYYIFRKEPGHKEVTQQTLALTFNNEGILIKIDNKSNLAFADN